MISTDTDIDFAGLTPTETPIASDPAPMADLDLIEYVSPSDPHVIIPEIVSTPNTVLDHSVGFGRVDGDERAALDTGTVQFVSSTTTSTDLAGNSTASVQTMGMVAGGAREILAKADLAFTVESAPIYTLRGGLPVQIEGKKALVRTDTEEPVGLAGDGRGIIQYGEWGEVVDMLIERANGELSFANAIKLDNGGAMVMQMARKGSVGRYDVKDMITLITSHNGRFAATLGFSRTMVVCDNTLAHALHEAKNGIKLKHTRHVAERFSLIADALEMSKAYAGALDNHTLRMMGQKMTDDQMVRLASKLIPSDSARAEGMREKLISAWTTAPGAAPGTRWGGLQAVTYYTSHLMGSRDTGRAAQAAKFESQYMGAAQKFSQSGFDVLTDDREFEGLANVQIVRRAL